MNISSLPIKLFSGYSETGHIQGIATDGEYMYYSCTTHLLKTDFKGNAVASVCGFFGHLGCIAYHDGFIYGSLEYKRDSIGKGILEKLGLDITIDDAFYIVRFDLSKLDKMGMNAENSGIISAVKLQDVICDYNSGAHGCSGIDGITVANYPYGVPALFVAYGIYSDVNRDDNDNQIILRLELNKLCDKWSALAQSNANGVQGVFADSKYFVYTGNTSYGIQNLEYDSFTNRFFAAVYTGHKEKFPNYNMFMIDLNKAPDQDRLALAAAGMYDDDTGIYGLRFKYGATGMISLGDGYFYFSEDGKDSNGYFTNVCLYRYDKNDFIKI